MDNVVHPLLARWPGLFGRLPLAPLGLWPTPVEPLLRLERSGYGEVWVKREDLASPVFGGNKVRKLEILLAGRDGPVVAFGGLGSHHVLATAVHANTLGRECIAVLVPQLLTDHAARVLSLVERHCAAVVRLDRARWASARTALARLGAAFGRATIVWPGGSSPAGVLGWVGAGLELAEQVRRGECPSPRRIFVACGTGGTAAGLALGLALAGFESEVVAVRVASRIAAGRPQLGAFVHGAVARLGLAGIRVAVPRLALSVDHRYAGPGYGWPTDESRAAVRLARDELGLELETTYTGKAMAALLDDARRDPAAGPRMLVHTCGSVDTLWKAEEAAREDVP